MLYTCVSLHDETEIKGSECFISGGYDNEVMQSSTFGQRLSPSPAVLQA